MSGFSGQQANEITKYQSRQADALERIATALERIAYPNIKIETVMQPTKPAPVRDAGRFH